MSTIRFFRTQYRLYLRAGLTPRHAIRRTVHSFFNGF